MSIRTRIIGRGGITLLEVILLLVVLAVVALLTLPHLKRHWWSGPQAKRIACVSNLKHAGLSFRQWGMDHGDTFPMSLAMTDGGTMDHPLAHEPWIHYQKLSNMMTPNDVISWTREMHRHKGNVALADSSVQQSSPARLQQNLAGAPYTNRLTIP